MDVFIVIYCDNISNILFVNNPVYDAKIKHIDVHYHFVQKNNLVREINLIYVNIKD